MPTFVISSVSAGSQTQWGQASIVNVAQGIFARGVRPRSIPLPVVYDGQFELLSFDFLLEQKYGFRFDFSPALRPFLPSGWESLTFGSFGIENAAQSFTPRSIRPAPTPQPIVADRDILRLEFDALPQNDLALHFTFSGPQVVVGRGHDSAQFGSFLVEAPITVAPSGWHSLRIPLPIVADRDILRLEFDLLPQNDLALHFTFSGPQVVVAWGHDSAQFGLTGVENAAQGIFAQGIPPSFLPSPIIYDARFKVLALDFQVVRYANAANIPFAFGTDRQAIFAGGDSSEFGFPDFREGELFVTPDSVPGVEIGVPAVRHLNQILLSGHQSSRFGTFFLPRDLTSILDPRVTHECWTRFDGDWTADEVVDLIVAGYPEGEGLQDVRWVTHDQLNPQRLVCFAESFLGRGVFESFDGGRTWALVGDEYLQGDAVGGGGGDDSWDHADALNVNVPLPGHVDMKAYTTEKSAVPQCDRLYELGNHDVEMTPLVVGDIVHQHGLRITFSYHYSVRSFNARTYELAPNNQWGGIGYSYCIAYNPSDGGTYLLGSFGATAQTYGFYTEDGFNWSVAQKMATPEQFLGLRRLWLVYPLSAQVVYHDGVFFVGGRQRVGMFRAENGAISDAFIPRNQIGEDITEGGVFFKDGGDLYLVCQGENCDYLHKYVGGHFVYQASSVLGVPRTRGVLAQIFEIDGYRVASFRSTSVSERTRYNWAISTSAVDPIDCTTPARLEFGPVHNRTLSRPVLSLHYSSPFGWRAEHIRQYHTPVLPRAIATDGHSVVVMGADTSRPVSVLENMPSHLLMGTLLPHSVVSNDPGNLNAPQTFRLYRLDWSCFKAFADSRYETQVVPADGQYTFEPGNAFISNYWRTVYGVGGHRADAYGTPWVSFYERVVRFSHDNYMTEPGFPTIGYHREVEMLSPVTLARFGKPHVDLRRILFESGIDSLEVSWPWISRSPRSVSPFSWAERAFGDAEVWNRLQFIEFQPPDTDPDTYRGVTFGRTWWFRVFNTRRVVRMSGLLATRFATTFADITLSGRAFVFSGHESHRFPPFRQWHLVAHYTRRVYMWGLDSFRIVTFHRVFNNARLLSYFGRDSAQYGRLHIWRSLQIVRVWSIRDPQYGRPWVSFGTREVQIVTSRQSLQMPHIIVGHTPLWVEMEGLYSFRFTNLFSFARPIPTITPRWMPTEWWDLRLVGVPRVHNVTPQVYPWGYSMLRMGERPMVSHYTRYVDMQGWDSFRFENLLTIFRNRTVFMDGRSHFVLSQHHTVWNVDPDRPSTRLLGMEGQDSWEDGRPVVRGNVLFFEGRNSLRVGSWEVQNNGILFRAGNFPQQGMFQSSTFAVFGGERVVEMEGREPLTLPKFRLTPHTIWMRLDTPAQARNNHPGPLFCEVDAFCDTYSPTPPWPWWGTARVWMPGDYPVRMGHSSNPAHWIRIRPGQPRVENAIRTVSPDPLNSYAPGFFHLFTAGGTVRMWTGREFESNVEYGTPFVWDNGPRWAYLSGISGAEFGEHEVQNQHRPVYMQGLDATQYGNNHPMVYHWPRGFTPVDSDMTQWGVAWFSHSPRWLLLEGHDSFTTDWVRWRDRMNVWLWTRNLATYEGFQSDVFGRLSVTSGVNNILPYGFVRACITPWHEVKHV